MGFEDERQDSDEGEHEYGPSNSVLPFLRQLALRERRAASLGLLILSLASFPSSASSFAHPPRFFYLSTLTNPLPQ
jgi:hypothetical protein